MLFAAILAAGVYAAGVMVVLLQPGYHPVPDEVFLPAFIGAMVANWAWWIPWRNQYWYMWSIPTQRRLPPLPSKDGRWPRPLAITLMVAYVATAVTLFGLALSPEPTLVDEPSPAGTVDTSGDFKQRSEQVFLAMAIVFYAIAVVGSGSRSMRRRPRASA